MRLSKQVDKSLIFTSNTGVFRLPTLQLDYLGISLINAEIEQAAPYLLGEMVNEFEVLDSKMSGFQKVLTNTKIFFHYENIGVKRVVYLEVKSQGCRYLEEKYGFSWQIFFKKIQTSDKHISMEKYNIKRIDIAMDSFKTDTLTPDRAMRYLKKSLVTSRFQTQRQIQEHRIANNELIGDSIYFGKRKSDCSIIIYDKRLESKKIKEGPYFRTEIRFKNLFAQRVVDELIENPDGFSLFISQILREKIQFRSENHQRSELRRRELAKWYERYLVYVGQQHLEKIT